MITCTLNDRKYTINYVTGRALREMEPAWNMYMKFIEDDRKAKAGEMTDDSVPLSEALDKMVSWFCVLFQNQFNEEDVYDGYPNDKLMPDIFFAMTAVQKMMTSALDEFPTRPAVTKTAAKKPTTSRK